MNRHRRDQGSALVVTTIVVVVTVAMMGLLLAAPQAQMAQASSSLAKQRAFENADAGLRDAITVMEASANNVQTWLPTGTSDVLCSGAAGTGQTAAALPSPAAPSYFPCWYSSTSLPANSNTNTPAFVTSNFEQFGDSLQSRGAYAYAIFPLAKANYYKVQVEGRALLGAALTQTQAGQPGAGTITGPNTVSAIIEAVIYIPNTIDTSTFSAVSFVNASGGAGNPPTQPFGTAGTQTQIMLLADKSKTYTNGWANNAGVSYPAQPTGTPTPTLTLDSSDPASSTTAAGNPPTNVLSGSSSLQSEYLAIANAAYTKANGATTMQQWTTGGYTLYYQYFPANSTIDNSNYGANPLDVHGMNNGIVIFDLGDNVTINLDSPSGNGNNIKGAFFRGNGNGSFGGTVLFIQRGKLNVTNNQFYLIDWNPANSSDNLLSFNQAAITGALQNLTLPPPVPKIASVRVIQ
ncbi:MAG TPA: hypothetical protein VFF73_09755 [Planctomycetota bacterium]|nr:hypothetical protein [Planctomycetota bacterium]